MSVLSIRQHSRTCPPLLLAARIWFLTSLVFGLGCWWYEIIFHSDYDPLVPAFAAFLAGIASLPVLLVLAVTLSGEAKPSLSYVSSIKRLCRICALCILPYALLGGAASSILYNDSHYVTNFLSATLLSLAALFACNLIALLLNNKTITHFFSTD